MKKLITILLLVLPLQCLAWGYKGHATVADIAWHYLTPEAQQQVTALLKANGFESLTDAANWPDRVRKDDEFKHTGNWHYINLPHGAEHYSSARDCQQGCAVSALNMMLKQLAESSDVKKRAQALAFVVHFVGDIHQPLHVSYADDKGGNTYSLVFEDQPVNLHYYWDTLVLKADPDDTELAAQLISQLTAKQIDTWQQAPVVDWVEESHRITEQVYASAPNKVTTQMLQEDRKIIHQRLQQAGVRLAYQLNQLLK